MGGIEERGGWNRGERWSKSSGERQVESQVESVKWQN
jgi:hypothetical protein